MELSLQEQEIINALRRLVAYERIEIMKDEKGHIGFDYVVFRASRMRIDPKGNINGTQIRSAAIHNND